MQTILVTGAAGFIGSFVCQRLLADGHRVVGIDNLNAYYEVSLKQDRLARLNALPQQAHFQFLQVGLEDRQAIESLFSSHSFKSVVHLAAQAGVRYSLEAPQTYIDSNITGFINILEGMRRQRMQAGLTNQPGEGPHLVYASSSSVYGGNKSTPFCEDQATTRPVSLYAATKLANELMAHTYSHLFGIPATGLRFFTVYGPWGRPDMAYFKFVRAILAGQTIEVYNNGQMARDFTYIDDIVEGILRVMTCPPSQEETGDADFCFETLAPHRVLNIGNHQPVNLSDFIAIIEGELGMVAKKKLMPIQPGDVPSTHADTRQLMALTGFAPKTDLASGMKRFIDWYKNYYF